MLNSAFALAAIIAVATLLTHVIAGGIYVVRPLLAVEGLTRASRWLNYYCWHMTTITIATMIAVFAYAATNAAAAPLAAAFTALAAAFSILCIAVALKGGIAPHRFPATTLFALIAIAGAAGYTLS